MSVGSGEGGGTWPKPNEVSRIRLYRYPVRTGGAGRVGTNAHVMWKGWSDVVSPYPRADSPAQATSP